MPVGTFFGLFAFLFAYGAAIYWYAKKLGGGDATSAWNDPNDQKRLLIVAAGLAVFLLIIIGVLFWIGTFKTK